MQKIPVFQTVGHAYGFAFGRYLSTLSIIWLPVLFLGVVAYFLVLPAFGHMLSVFSQIAQHPQDNATNTALLTEMNRGIGYVQLFNLIEFVVLVVVFTGITKEALGLRTGSRFYYLQFGSAELNVLVAFILMVVIIIGVTIAVALGGGILGGIAAVAASAAGGSGSTAVTALMVGVVVVAAFCVAFYLLARALYLLVPVSVAENQIGISKSWNLARGNILRIFAISLLIFLPILIAELAAFMVFLAPLGVALADDQKRGGQEAVQQHLAALAHQAPGFMIGFGVVAFLLSPIIYGLLVSAPAFAYRALVPAGAPKDAADHFR
jgi:hypothetical protein